MTGEPPATRHQSRERALSLLYEAEMKEETPAAVVSSLAVPPDPYCAHLIEALEDNREQVDALVAGAAIGWEPDRMAVVDRLVLQLATAELLDPGGPPEAVVLDEAVELAKVYSTDDSGSFVNGVLAAIVKTLAKGQIEGRQVPG